MSLQIKWLFFDVGSTLIDEQGVYENRLKEIAQLADEPYEEVYKLAIDFYKQNKKGDIEVARVLGVVPSEWNNNEERLYSDTHQCLELLHSKYKIGVIANQPFGTSSRLEKLGILKYIDLVISSAEEGVKKPDTRIFELALSKANCKPDEAFMIGDRIDNDIIPAKKLGVHTIWVKQGFGRYWIIEDECEQADYIVENLAEICKLL